MILLNCKTIEEVRNYCNYMYGRCADCLFGQSMFCAEIVKPKSKTSLEADSIKLQKIIELTRKEKLKKLLS